MTACWRTGSAKIKFYFHNVKDHGKNDSDTDQLTMNKMLAFYKIQIQNTATDFLSILSKSKHRNTITLFWNSKSSLNLEL